MAIHLDVVTGIRMNGSDYASELERLRARRQSSAEEAWRSGKAALDEGDIDNAANWLDRARRLAPGNPTVELALATAWLRQSRPEAADLFEELASRHDVRPAWVGLAAARMGRGEPAAAAQALGRMLAGQAIKREDSLGQLAADIASAAGAPGWCAFDGSGGLSICFVPDVLGASARANRHGTVRIALDGRLVATSAPRSGTLRLTSGWKRAHRLVVSLSGRELLGSPIDLARIRQCEGFVRCREGGIEGWAWLPADPDTDPLLRALAPACRSGFSFTATDTSMTVDPERPLARPRRFHIPPERLARLPGPVHVLGSDGRDLLGSPLDPSADILSCPRLIRRTAGASVVIPVYGGRNIVLPCLETVLATIPWGTKVIVVDDASPEAELGSALQRLSRRGCIRVIRHRRNRGFPAAANTGLRAAGGSDAVLLNSDTLVPKNWLERLREAAYSAADIGTATPFSNEATILSYPSLYRRNPVPDLAATRRLAAQAWRANANRVVEIPTAIGFCMYMRRDCLDAVGLFREDVFAQGYGEENDFCMRARHLGWRHVAACGVFVAHIGGQSFGAAKTHLLARNLELLNRLHPGYDALIAAHNRADPLSDARRRFDIVRWRAARRQKAAGSVLLITHDRGGGVERLVEARMAATRAEGLRPIVVSPVLRSREPSYAGECRITDDSGEDYPNLRFALPRELDALVPLLRERRVVRAELHHLLGHDHSVLELCRKLGVPYDVFIHDYAWFCPRISLLGADRRYCGEPDVAHCEACVGELGRKIEENITVRELRQRSERDLAGASRVIAPSADAAARIRRHFARVRPEVMPWEEDPSPSRPVTAPNPNAERRVCLIGAIGPEKGYDVLLNAARDAAERSLPLRFVVIGYTIDDDPLLQTGRVFVSGEYRESEVGSLVAAHRPDFAWLPSVWPETWCFALSEAWRAGLDVVAFDIGAQAERIRRAGRGLLLPLGLPPPALNQALLSAFRSSPHAKNRVKQASSLRSVEVRLSP